MYHKTRQSNRTKCTKATNNKDTYGGKKTQHIIKAKKAGSPYLLNRSLWSKNIPSSLWMSVKNTYLQESYSSSQVSWRQLSYAYKIQFNALHWESFLFIINHSLAATRQRLHLYLSCPSHWRVWPEPQQSWQESVGKFMTLSLKIISLVTLPPVLNLTVIVLPKNSETFLWLSCLVRIQIDRMDFQNYRSAKSY